VSSGQRRRTDRPDPTTDSRADVPARGAYRLGAVTLAPPIVWSDRHRLREPHREMWIRVRTRGSEVQRRADAIPNALPASGATYAGAEPGASRFPPDRARAHGSGARAGAGPNRDLAVPPGTADAERPAAVEALARRAAERRATALLVALDLDAVAGDAANPLNAIAHGGRDMSRALEGMDLATVLDKEGGDDLTTIGALRAETLAGFREGATRA
jgi:hypothetical protein